MPEDPVKVLAVDDSQDNLVALEALFRAFLPSCTTSTARSGKEGIAEVEAFQPDVILLDVQMPGMNGFDVCRALKGNAATRHIPVIFLTAHDTDSASWIRGLEIGADAFLTKPVEPGELMAQVRAMARIKRAEDVLRGEKLSLELAVGERTTALKESGARNRALLDAIPDAMLLLSADGVCVDCHAREPFVFFDSPGQVVGKPLGEILPPHEAGTFQAAAAAALSTGTLQVFEYALERQGEERHFDARVVPCGTSNALAIVRDVSDRRRADAELRRHAEDLRVRSDELAVAVKELERASRAKDEFLATTSHELRTPLNGILGMAEVVRSGIQGPLNEKQARSIRLIEDGGRHLLELINDILDVAKIEAGRLPMTVELCSVVEICEASLSMVRQTAQRRRIELLLEPEADARHVRADARRLKQILVNLLSNGVKFTPEGGRVGLEVSLDEQRRTIRFTVWDSGVGIAAEDFPRLFQPFTQLDARLAREYGGTGLGLTLVRRLTELHGGSVEVDSVKGRGSRFSVFLPWGAHDLKPGAVPAGGTGPETAVVQARVVSQPSSAAPVILLVEDDPVAVEVLETFLPARGFRLVVARTGPEALELVATTKPDIVLMDIQLPGMDGLEVIRRLRAQEGLQGTPVIALTALAMSGDRERVLAAGADDYVSKPIPLKALEAKLRALDGMERRAVERRTSRVQ